VASFRKHGKVWYYRFVDSDGEKRERKGSVSKRETEVMAQEAEVRARRIMSGEISAKEAGVPGQQRRPLVEHIAEWQADLIAKAFSGKHAVHTSNRVRRLATIVLGHSPSEFDPRLLPPAERNGMTAKLAEAIGDARLSCLTCESAQDAIAQLRDSGSSLQTCCHYRASARAFSAWSLKSGRAYCDELHDLEGYNAKEDPKHYRRTVGTDELQRLIDVTYHGPRVAKVSGPVRSLAYRLASAVGLRYAELSSLTTRSFDFENGPSVTLEAAYAKNGKTAKLYLPVDLASDLAAYVATLKPGATVFPLPAEKGARMLRSDLRRAGIPYRDEAGHVFDFHSLRCQLATMADAAGISPRVVQRMMRHSSLELTSRYTRPRTSDIKAASAMIPSPRPTDSPDISNRFSHHFPTKSAGTAGHDAMDDGGTCQNLDVQSGGKASPNPFSWVNSPRRER